jgi:2-polyprenyl-3-methyl-5-hydroxy-6-metoxy-1,4-benzoquinol methylase
MDEAMYHSFLAAERRHWWFRARREILVALARRWVPPGGRVLDLGCGTGFFLEALAGTHEVRGLDASPLAVAMSRVRGLAGVAEGTAEDLSAVADERFDLVTLLDVIEHLDDDLGALRRARALLKPGGRLLVTVPAYPALWSYHDERNRHRRRYRRTPLRNLCATAGLTAVHATHFNAALLPLAWAARAWRR